MRNTLFMVLVLALAAASCKKEESVMEKDDKTIQTYFKNKDITDVIKDPSGVYIQHIKEGTGKSPILSDRVTVKYELYTLPEDKQVPQTDEPITFELRGLITGWKIGIPYMKKSGVAYLYVPSTHAYRDGKVLKFKITLINF